MGPNNELILQFNSVEDWENTIDVMGEYDDSLLSIYETSFSGYVSQRMLYLNEEEKENGIENPNEDDVLASNLSASGIVIIENKAYMPDFVEDLIYVCKTVNHVNLKNLKNKNVSDTSIFSVYDSEIEVLHLAEEAENELKHSIQERNVDRRKCNESKAKKDKDVSGNQNYCKNEKRLKAKIAYQKSGIYFTLLMEVEHFQKNNNGRFKKNSKNLYVKYDFRAKKRCKSEWNGRNNAYPQYNYQDINKWQVKIYRGTRSLSKYDLYMDAYVKDDCGLPGKTKGWGGTITDGY